MKHKVYRLYRYALFLLDRFKYLILLAVVVYVISTWVLWTFHPEQAHPATRKGLGEVSFGVFELMFASEPALPYPKGSVISQVVFFLLPVLNVLGLAAAVAQFSQILFDRGLYNRAQADNADGHVILCGIGRLGREVLKQLDRRLDMKRRRDVVIVEGGTGADALDTEFVQREPIIPVLHGNMADAAVLHGAGIERAAAVMMLTGDDTTNLEAALLAREMNPNVRVVLRMSNKRVSQRLDVMLRGSLVRNFQLIDSVEGSAPKCLDLCRLPGLAPDADQATCSLTTSIANLDAAEGHVITESPAVPILRGDMTVKRVLQQARVDRAAAVLIMTPNDTQNLETAMLAHELNPRVQMVMRINNSRISQRLDRVLREVFGETLRVIDPSEHAAPHFVEAIRVAYEQAPQGGAAYARPHAGAERGE